MNNERFANQCVVVTGGVSGIGLALARGFASEGASVQVTALTDAEVAAFKPPHPAIRVSRLDVRDSSSINAFVSSLERIDVLVNTAGTILRDGKEYSSDGFENVIDVNLNGTMRMCLACYEKLATEGGAIINVGSLFSTFGAPHAPAYSASKGAVVQLTKSLAAKWAMEDIRVNAVSPGWIRTPFTAAVSESEERSHAIVSRTPMGRWGEPDDVVGPVLFLASNEARFVTGSVIPVDGGYSVV